ncbi:hypothetical protein AVEN_35663-1 [Araneus ventricosus]|uniref:Helitron helicase-like domain-containing protein n=1 Tax=Araneus ventricosus TaxID=182803 RepID=A0A4Y2GC33_ARAVE|nr:hypothetical protein AVEN_35663-1 [Araneus ventricosus]
MVRKFGRPDLLVTFACNTTWVDILNVLEGPQRPEDKYSYGRYVSAPEAMWCLNAFNLSEKPHTVIRLAVHLRDQQAIVYQDGQEEEAVARAATRQTTLTAWFELNKNYQDSHNYLYTDIPHYYTFNKRAMKWQKRQ